MLVGRDDELREIRELLASVRLGRSGGLLLTGEPGVGKSALLAEAGSLAESMHVLRATGREAESLVAFGGLLELLRPALASLPLLPPPQRDALEGALAMVPATGTSRFAVGAAVLGLLCRHAEQRPVLLLLDDAQWLDQPTLDALRFAVGRLADDPVAVLAAARPDPEGLEIGLPLRRLDGLDEAASRTLVKAASARPLTSEQVSHLHRVTGGNPLALLEFAQEPDSVRSVYPEGPLAAPAAVGSTFAAQASGLGETTRTMLLTVAAAGNDLRIVATACAELGLDSAELTAAVVAGEDAGLVVLDGDRIEFRHPVMRSAVYAAATPEERRRTHRAVASGIPADDPDRRAWHLAEAALLPDEELARQLDDVGARASARSAHAVAALAKERAAQLSPDRGRARERLLEGVEASWLAGQSDLAERLLAEVEEGETPSAAALALRGMLAAHTASRDDTCQLLVAAAEASGDPDLTLYYLADAVADCYYLADGGAASLLAERLEDALPRGHTNAARAVGMMGLGMARILTGRRGGAEQMAAASRLLADDPGIVEEFLRGGSHVVGNPHRLCFLLLGPLWLRDAEGGRLREVVARLREDAALGVLPRLLFLLGRDQATSDRWARAKATYADGIRLARESGETRDRVMSLSGLAWLEARCGRDDESHAHIEEARAADRDGRVRHARMWQMLAAGERHLVAGRAAEAADELTRLDALQREVGLLDVDTSPDPERAEALCRLGRTDEARDLAASFADRARSKGQPWALARSERALAVTGPDEDLDAHLEAALALHEKTLDGFETARTRLVVGERLRRARRRRDAREQLREAVSAFDRLGAVPWAERAAAELAATGETARRREVGAAERLTPQELQVVTLLTDGHTTREAATALFLSPKTVEYHLRKAYLKLGVNSREALARALSE